jgi:hypothetical protein
MLGGFSPQKRAILAAMRRGCLITARTMRLPVSRQTLVSKHGGKIGAGSAELPAFSVPFTAYDSTHFCYSGSVDRTAHG